MTINMVVPDEPWGYRGRRRRFLFPFVHKAGGVAVPVLLVAASIVVVLGVVLGSPHQAAGLIPSGGGSGQPTGTGTTVEPYPSPSSTSHKLARPGARPSATPQGSNPATFSPLSLEAESATLSGGAHADTCTGCSGRLKVRNIGKNRGAVTFAGIIAPRATQVQVTIAYTTTQPRDLYIAVNGTYAVTVLSGSTPDWGTTATMTITVSLRSGANSITLYNPVDWAPDLDLISIRAV
jgi:hypothetical protein